MKLYMFKLNYILIIMFLILVSCGEATQMDGEGISGTYFFVRNDCEDDGEDITIVQNGSDLTFNDAFNAGPSPYSGTIDAEGNISFTNGDGECEAEINKDGIFVGICHFPDEDCEFFYTPPI